MRNLPQARDVFLGWSWLPFYAATAFFATRGTHTGNASVVAMVGVAFTISVLHQPLTLLVVYGERASFADRRGLFVWLPLIAIAVVGMAIVAKLWFVVPLGAAWQLFHTQQQRYGVLRRYDPQGSARMDRLITYVPFAAALLAVALQDVTRAQLRLVGHKLGGNNFRAISGALDALDGWQAALPPVASIVAITVIAYAAHDARTPFSWSKWSYLASGFVLLAGLVINPVAGFVAYLVAHALEYVTVVHRRMAVRMHAPMLALAALCVFVAIFALLHTQVLRALPSRLYVVVSSAIGVMHFFYDGLIWKRRSRGVPYRRPTNDSSPRCAAPRTAQSTTCPL